MSIMVNLHLDAVLIYKGPTAVIASCPRMHVWIYTCTGASSANHPFFGAFLFEGSSANERACQQITSAEERTQSHADAAHSSLGLPRHTTHPLPGIHAHAHLLERYQVDLQGWCQLCGCRRGTDPSVQDWIRRTSAYRNHKPLVPRIAEFQEPPKLVDVAVWEDVALVLPRDNTAGTTTCGAVCEHSVRG